MTVRSSSCHVDSQNANHAADTVYRTVEGYVPAEILNEIARLQETKALTDEKSLIPFPEILSDYTELAVLPE